MRSVWIMVSMLL